MRMWLLRVSLNAMFMTYIITSLAVAMQIEADKHVRGGRNQ